MNCKTCKYFNHLNEVWGRCQRHPPVQTPTNTQGHWPQVRPVDFCGEWAAVDGRRKPRRGPNENV